MSSEGEAASQDLSPSTLLAARVYRMPELRRLILSFLDDSSLGDFTVVERGVVEEVKKARCHTLDIDYWPGRDEVWTVAVPRSLWSHVRIVRAHTHVASYDDATAGEVKQAIVDRYPSTETIHFSREDHMLPYQQRVRDYVLFKFCVERQSIWADTWILQLHSKVLRIDRTILSMADGDLKDGEVDNLCLPEPSSDLGFAKIVHYALDLQPLEIAEHPRLHGQPTGMDRERDARLLRFLRNFDAMPAGLYSLRLGTVPITVEDLCAIVEHRATLRGEAEYRPVEIIDCWAVQPFTTDAICRLLAAPAPATEIRLRTAGGPQASLLAFCDLPKLAVVLQDAAPPLRYLQLDLAFGSDDEAACMELLLQNARNLLITRCGRLENLTIRLPAGNAMASLFNFIRLFARLIHPYGHLKLVSGNRVVECDEFLAYIDTLRMTRRDRLLTSDLTQLDLSGIHQIQQLKWDKNDMPVPIWQAEARGWLSCIAAVKKAHKKYRKKGHRRSPSDLVELHELATKLADNRDPTETIDERRALLIQLNDVYTKIALLDGDFLGADGRDTSYETSTPWDLIRQDTRNRMWSDSVSEDEQ